MDELRESRPPRAGEKTWFFDHTRLPTVLPRRAWALLRLLSVSATLGLLLLLWHHPDLGLKLFWGVAVPLLPLVFWLAPAVWRNVCPLASVNQWPRRLGLTGQVQRIFPTRWAYPLGMAAALGLIISRKAWFNQSALATLALVAGALGLAVLGGLLFKGKSGWCSSICPLLPVQRLYGQAPLALLAQTQCEPCVGCAKHCMDAQPGAAHLSDQYDDDPEIRHYRRLFAGVWPGLVIGYYLVPDAPALAPWAIFSKMSAYLAVSYTAFQVLDHLLARTRNTLPALFAAVAISLYYGFGASGLAHHLTDLGLPVPDAAEHVFQGLVVMLAVFWFLRALRIERAFLARRAEPQSASVAVRPVHVHPRVAFEASASEAVQVQVEPDGRVVKLGLGQSLLNALEDEECGLQASCRNGLCGSDLVTVLEGATCLNLPGPDEQATLARIGAPQGTRLACVTRAQAAGTVRLRTGAHGMAEGAQASRPLELQQPAAAVDPSVRSVVIVGNGVAGVTVAEHVRRLNPQCEIHLIGRETRPAYNRMAIARLIPKGLGVHGLLLQPGDWYQAHRITTWLNTQAVRIQRKKRRLLLATGETLAYDRLILATGASAWVPPIQHADASGCFVLRDADDAMAIRAHAQRHGAKRALIVGAGLLGLEAAQALTDLGLKVTVLSHIDTVLDQQIDAQASVMLSQALERLGITLAFNAAAQSIMVDGQGRVAGMSAADGRSWAAELVLVCAGTRANTDLARAAGLKVGRGITVDATLRTSDKSIYAVGDAAEFQQERHGLWAVAVEQARIAAAHALGVPHPVYEGHVPVTRLKVSGVQVCSAGRIEASANGHTRVHRSADTAAYRKLVVEEGRVVGAVLIGPCAHTDALLDAVRRHAPLEEVSDAFEESRGATA